MMHKFYVFGLQRSGTNFFRSLLTENFDVQVANDKGTWWHYNKPPFQNMKAHKAFVVYKNPYQWIESIVYRNSADIIPTNINTYDLEFPDGYMINGINLERLCRLYADFGLNWKHSHFINVRYEDLIEEETRNSLLSSLTYVRKNDTTWKIPNGVFMSEKFNVGQVDYYKKKTIQYLKQEELDLINKIIPDIVFETIGYKRVFGG